MMKTVLALLALARPVAAHVTLVPNYGAAAGNYFQFDVKIPHGEDDSAGNSKDTTKIEITVPHGVSTVKPEAVYGWDITITERDIVPYMSHGNTVDKGPATITYTAKCSGGATGSTCTNADHGGLDNEHLMLLSMQIKLGCDFGRDKAGAGTSDATVWMDQHTIWWPVTQWTSTAGTNDGNSNDPSNAYKSWSGVVSGTASWGMANNGAPSPYLFIYSDEKCTQPDNSGANHPDQVGMRWGVNSDIIAPAADQDPIKTKAEVLSLMNEETLDLEEEMASLRTDLNDKIDAIQLDKADIKHCAIVALCVACILMVAFLTLCIFRATKPRHFREYLLSAPLIDDRETTPKSIEIGTV